MEPPALEQPTAGEWLKRLLVQLVDRAVSDSADLEDHSQLALHRLRLRMKKADALLLLSKGALREAAVGQLRKQIKEIKNSGGGQRDWEVVAALANELRETCGLNLDLPPQPQGLPEVKRLTDLLRRLRRELSETILDGLTWEDVEESFRACYRSGRRRMRKACETGESEDFHRLRKRVKALQYQTQALAPALEHIEGRLKDLRKLGKYLGREHDLNLLEQVTGSQSPNPPCEPVIEARREKLRHRIEAHASKVFKQPAREFARMRCLPV